MSYRNVALALACLLLSSCYESNRQLFASNSLTGTIAAGDWLEVGKFYDTSAAELTPEMVRAYDCERLLDGYICLKAEDGSPRHVVHQVSRQSSGVHLVLTDATGDSYTDKQVGAVDLGGGVMLLEASDIGSGLWHYGLGKRAVTPEGAELLLTRVISCDANCEVTSPGQILAIARQANRPEFFSRLADVTVYQRR